MRYVLVIALSLFLAAPAVLAQTSVSAEQIEKMLGQAKQHNGRVKINTNTIMVALGMHGCLQEKIGDDGIKRLGDWGSELNRQVKPLCAAGQRDEAYQLQLRYAQSVMKTPEYAGVKACTAQYKDMLDDPMFTQIRAVVESPDTTDQHICDYQKG